MKTQQQAGHDAGQRAESRLVTQETLDRPAARWRRPALALIPVAAALAVAGCGGDETQSVATERRPQVAIVQPVERPTPAAEQASMAEEAAAVEMTPAVLAGERKGAESAEELPPDIVVSAPDTLVSPGEAVVFTAHGTPDVAEIVLWDGINDRQAFSYDDVEGVWRVYYRVPLRPASERLGLSVTARTEANHWRRLWIFLRVQQPTVETQETAADGS